MKEVLALIALFLFFLAILHIIEGIAMKNKPVVRADKKNAITFFIWGMLFFLAGMFFIYLVGGPIAVLIVIKNMITLLWSI